MKMANKKKQFDQEFKQNAVNYCLTHPELSRKELNNQQNGDLQVNT